MNKEKTVKFLWISMWATLILMVVLKLTFNYYYPIVIENSKLLEISYWFDKNIVLSAIIDYILYLGNCLLISLCVLKEKWFKKKWHIVLLLSIYTISFPFKYINTWIALAISLIGYIIIPLFITSNSRKWIFITFILDNAFQILSNIARGNSLVLCDTFIFNKIMAIDYYLLFIIYYIGVCCMGTITILPWFTKKETVIDAKIEKLEKKIKKLEEQKECLKKR